MCYSNKGHLTFIAVAFCLINLTIKMVCVIIGMCITFYGIHTLIDDEFNTGEWYGRKKISADKRSSF